MHFRQLGYWEDESEFVRRTSYRVCGKSSRVSKPRRILKSLYVHSGISVTVTVLSRPGHVRRFYGFSLMSFMFVCVLSIQARFRFLLMKDVERRPRVL